MCAPAPSPNKINKLLRRFRSNRRGSAAIEFALVAPLFFGLLFAIMETAMVFLASQILETGTNDSARLLYTNQALNNNMTQVQFETDVCNRVKVLFSCGANNTNLTVVVKAYAPGVAIQSSDLVTPISGGAFTGSPAFTMPKSGDTVLVRVYYQWPLFVTGLGYNIATLFNSGGTDNKRLLAASAAFRVEPNGS